MNMEDYNEYKEDLNALLDLSKQDLIKRLAEMLYWSSETVLYLLLDNTYDKQESISISNQAQKYEILAVKLGNSLELSIVMKDSIEELKKLNILQQIRELSYMVNYTSYILHNIVDGIDLFSEYSNKEKLYKDMTDRIKNYKEISEAFK